MQRLTDLNAALIKAKTERINKEALYNQLKLGAGDRRDRYASGGSVERIRPGVEDEPLGCPAAAGPGGASATARSTPR